MESSFCNARMTLGLSIFMWSLCHHAVQVEERAASPGTDVSPAHSCPYNQMEAAKLGLEVRIASSFRVASTRLAHHIHIS